MSSSLRFKYASFVLLASAALPCFTYGQTAIVLSGTAAPGGGTYGAFANPVLNSTGQVAFNASITGGTSTGGVFTGTAGALQAVALQGTASPNGELFGTLFSSSTTELATLNSSGQLAFIAPLTSGSGTGGTSTSGVFTGKSAATLSAVALQGTAAPAGGNYNAFAATGINSASSPVLNSSGQVAFSSTLTGGANGSGIFDGTPGSLQTVALLGTTAPTTPAGPYATALTAPVLNASGQVAFLSLVNGAQGVFFGSPGSVVAAAYGATPAGGTYNSFSSEYVNNNGQIVVQSSITAGSATSGIFAGTPGSTLQTVALVGGTAPGTGGETYGALSSVTLNGANQTAFTASSLSGGTITSGLFLGAPGSVQAVALGSSTGVGGTVDPDGSGATIASFSSTELPNSVGQVVFIANLIGTGVTSGSNSQALFGGTAGNLIELVRTGESLDLGTATGGNEFRTVSGFGLLVNSGGQDGKGDDFNDSGEVAYRLTFTDGTSGIFESTISAVPEPTSLGLLAAAAGLLIRRRPAKQR